MRRAAALIVLLIAGCSDPESSRLSTGQMAMLVNEFEGKDKVIVDQESGGTLTVPAGTPVRIARDYEDGAERTRKVSVVILGEGPNQGKQVKALRFDLRPN